jgi:uncharacterized protein (TIGR02145 family)
MKKIYSKPLFIALALIMVLSCSKDDSSANIVGGVVYRSQIVTIDVPNLNLSNQEYEATFNGLPITLAKSHEHKLVFLVPYSTPLGEQVLTIPSIDNATVKYEVKNTELIDTAEATLAPFFTNVAAYSQSLDTSPESVVVQNSLNSFNNYFANATDDEKTEMAILYQANKVQFDRILLYDFSDVTGKLTASDIIIVAKHSLAVVFAVGGTYAVIAGDLATKLLGATVAIVSFQRAKYFHNILVDRNLNTVGLFVDSIFGSNNKLSSAAATSVVFQNDTERILNFSVSDRKLIESDSNSTRPGMASFFTDSNRYNYFANKANVALQWINNNVPLISFGLVPLEQLPSSVTAVNTNVTQETYSKIQFSINHPNLQLVSSSLLSTGQLKMKVKIIGTPAVIPVVSFLNYSYSDDFNNFSGKLPIQVEAVSPDEVVIGTQVWKTKNLDVATYRNGDPIPQVTDNAQWINLTTGAWCYYENNTANGTTYGKLYNWYAVNDPRGLAPADYHVPSDAEWTTLTTFLGGEDVAGGKIKATTLWNSPNTAATNISGFTGLPGGYRYYGGTFYVIGSFGIWWSSTQYDSTYAWSRNLYYSNGIAYRDSSNKNYGFSVRCLRD